MLSPVRVSAPGPLVTLDEARQQLRVEFSDDDELIEALIASATQYLDGWSGVLGRALVTQTWRQDFCRFCDRLALPLGPAAEVVSVTYFDGANVQQTLDDSVYALFDDAAGPYVGPRPGQSWPSTYARPDAVSITYVAGQDAADVPAPIKRAVLMLVAQWYDVREAAVTGTIATKMPFAVEALIAPYRRVGM